MGKRAYRNRDHIRRRNMPAPRSEEFEAHLQELLRPSVYSQLNCYRQIGLRERILSLPLMVVAVLPTTGSLQIGQLNGGHLTRHDIYYLWTGSFNGVKFQVWATWLFYIVLLDLADAVADELSVPTEHISIEILFRGLYHFTIAASKGTATDPIRYFTAPENKDT